MKTQATNQNQTRSRIVLIHGAGHDKSVWSALVTELDQMGIEAMALNLPGHGDSNDALCADIESMASWLIDALRATTDQPVAIAGHSMGSLVSLEACARAPDLFSQLILIGSVLPMPVASALLDAARNTPESAYAMINKWSFAPDSKDTLREDNLAMMRRQAADVLHNDLSACNAYINGFESAKAVKCPVCLISGATDKMTPTKAITPLRQALEQSENSVAMFVLENAGHAMLTEQAHNLANTLKDWFHKQ